MGRDPTYEYLMEVKRCMLNDTINTSSRNTPGEEEGEEESGPQPITREGEPRITLGRLKACPRVVEDLHRHARRPKAWTPGVMEEVWVGGWVGGWGVSVRGMNGGTVFYPFRWHALTTN